MSRPRWHHHDDGRLRLRRTFAFEYSDTGDNRRAGYVTLLGQEVESIHLRPSALRLVSSRDTHDETLH